MRRKENPDGEYPNDVKHDLLQPFSGPALDPRMRWHCEPAQWEYAPASGLRMTVDAPTDFWQKTHYGFEADNGHFLYADVSGDFVMSARIRYQPMHQYDQSGLMVRHSPACWLKTSVEYEPEEPDRLGVVVTNHRFSDWSTQSVVGDRREVVLRVTRTGSDFLCESSWNGRDWQQIRLAHLHLEPATAPVQCGIYGCSPKERGFVAEFSELSIRNVGA